MLNNVFKRYRYNALQTVKLVLVLHLSSTSASGMQHFLPVQVAVGSPWPVIQIKQGESTGRNAAVLHKMPSGATQDQHMRCPLHLPGDI